MDLKLCNKLALVTGSSKGIGKAIAATLAQEGAEVILVARSADTIESVRREIATPKHAHHAYAFDLMEPGGVSRLVDRIRSEGREPDIIVHNLGGSFGVPAFASSL